MEKVLACRVCLITDAKLFDMIKCRLTEPFEDITGFRVSSDGLPRHICSICVHFLQKSISFKHKCEKAQIILQNAIKDNQKLTTAFLKTIDRKHHSLSLPLTTQSIHENYVINEIEVSYPIKEETYCNYYEDNNESDEEPLVRIIKKKQKKNVKKKIEIENDTNNVDVDSQSETDMKKQKKNVKKKIEIENDINNVDSHIETDMKKQKKTVKKKIVIENNDTNNVETDIQVIVLSKEDQIAEVESRKNSANYLNSFYKCGECYKGFLTSGTYKNHMVKHDPASGSHVCGVCRTRWPTAGALRTHVVTSHERQYLCRKCDHVSKSSHAAREHSKWHLGFKYTCKICGATFTKSSSHLTHIRVHHPSEHGCDLCGEAFIGLVGLALHRKKVHKDQISKVKSELRCPKCAAIFRSAVAVQRHLEHCDTNLRPCLTCGEGFSSEEKLNEHSRMHLNDKVKCKECNRTFAHQKSFNLHYHRRHLSNKPAVQNGDRFVCEVCGKKCVSKAALRYHQRSHTGEKPYPCTVCQKRFSMPMFLQTHMRTHTGERPYACARCPKTFGSRPALIRHNRVHTGVKPYQCPECDKSFTQSNSRKLHVRTVHRQPGGRSRGAE